MDVFGDKLVLNLRVTLQMDRRRWPDGSRPSRARVAAPSRAPRRRPRHDLQRCVRSYRPQQPSPTRLRRGRRTGVGEMPSLVLRRVLKRSR